MRLDRRHLLFVGAKDVVDASRRRGIEMVGAATRRDQRAGDVARRVEAFLDELERGRPVEPHAALRGIHRLGDAEAERPQALSIRDRRVPVDRAIEPGVDGRERVGDDVRCRVSGARERQRRRVRRARCSAAHGVALEAPAGGRKLQGERGSHGRGPQIASGATSTQRRSFQLASAASTSCTPLAPSPRVHLYGASSTT